MNGWTALMDIDTRRNGIFGVMTSVIAAWCGPGPCGAYRTLAF